MKTTFKCFNSQLIVSACTFDEINFQFSHRNEAKATEQCRHVAPVSEYQQSLQLFSLSFNQSFSSLSKLYRHHHHHHLHHHQNHYHRHHHHFHKRHCNCLDFFNCHHYHKSHLQWLHFLCRLYSQCH